MQKNPAYQLVSRIFKLKTSHPEGNSLNSTHYFAETTYIVK